MLRGLHPSSNLDEIKSEIEASGHKVVRITNICNNRMRSPTPLFFVELQPQENNKLIYDLKHLLQTIISVEQRYKKRIYHNVQDAKFMDTPKIIARVFPIVLSVQESIWQRYVIGKIEATKWSAAIVVEIIQPAIKDA